MNTEIKQPKLLNGGNHAHPSSGPVFEAGPGWGAKLKKWFRKNYKRFAIAVSVGIIVVAVSAMTYKQRTGNRDEAPKIIVRSVDLGDSKTVVARKILADYLGLFPDPLISNGQKVFIEEKLRKTLSKDLAAGERVEFQVEDIKAVIDQSRQLSPSQLEKWEAYAKNVKFQ